MVYTRFKRCSIDWCNNILGLSLGVGAIFSSREKLLIFKIKIFLYLSHIFHHSRLYTSHTFEEYRISTDPVLSFCLLGPILNEYLEDTIAKFLLVFDWHDFENGIIGVYRVSCCCLSRHFSPRFFALPLLEAQ